MNPNRRLLSLDTLRGVDMFFIMGFSGLVTSLCALWPGSFTDMLASQMQHAAWNGLTIQDTIFPLFLFIAGVAFPFSLAKQRARGFGRKRILDRIFRRGLILALLGMVYNGLFELNFSSLRIASVLGRIGLAWMFAALLCVYCSVRTRIAVAGIILIGYSLLLGLVVAPDAPVGADPLSVEGCGLAAAGRISGGGMGLRPPRFRGFHPAHDGIPETLRQMRLSLRLLFLRWNGRINRSTGAKYTAMMNPNRRLLSLDTLRGVDMFFIMGFSGLVTSLCALWPGSFTDMLASQMQHAAWNGLTIQDTIFPLFLFIAGVAFPFSLAKQRARGFGRKRILDRIFRRGLILALLGMVYNGLFELNFSSLRIASVLGRIGLAWMFAALLCVYCSVRTRIAVAGIILIGYSLLLGLVVAPDAPVGADPLSVEGCLAGWIDRQYLPGHILYGAFDPEGILSTLPAVVSALFGMFTGEFLLDGRRGLSGSWKAFYMAVAALAITTAGLCWNLIMPVNKNLWSSSFTCVVSGYSLGMTALFYYLIDVCGYKRWTFVFRVIGLNSITIYMAQRIIPLRYASDFFVGGLASKCSETVGAVIYDIGYIVLCWLFLYFLYRKNTFLKV